KIGEGEKKQRGGETANDCYAQLDLDKSLSDVFVDKSRQPRAHTHRKQIYPNYYRELSYRIAEHIARQSAGQQLVNEPAGRNDHDRESDREYDQSDRDEDHRCLDDVPDLFELDYHSEQRRRRSG